MRSKVVLLAVLAVAVPLASGCVPEEKKDLLAYPPGYQPKTADLTFNEARLDAFNSMSAEQQDTFASELEGQAGQFKGQAVLIAGNGLGETVPDSQYGNYEVHASTPDPVLYEITIEYHLFTDRETGKALSPHRPLEFTGTMIGLRYESESKPRKLKIRVKADELKTITK